MQNCLSAHLFGRIQSIYKALITDPLCCRDRDRARTFSDKTLSYSDRDFFSPMRILKLPTFALISVKNFPPGRLLV